MSADGRFVTYDPDGAIFLYDRQSNTTITIAAPGSGFTYSAPTISSDGHYVVFQGSNGHSRLSSSTTTTLPMPIISKPPS